jgi:hypothetical protein
MLKHKGGDSVKAGFYWNKGRWAAEIVPAEGGALPGEPETSYYRIAWPVLLVVAPVMGGAFAMFLPFIGLYMLAMLLLGRLKKGERRTPPAADASATTETTRRAA